MRPRHARRRVSVLSLLLPCEGEEMKWPGAARAARAAPCGGGCTRGQPHGHATAAAIAATPAIAAAAASPLWAPGPKTTENRKKKKKKPRPEHYKREGQRGARGKVNGRRVGWASAGHLGMCCAAAAAAPIYSPSFFLLSPSFLSLLSLCFFSACPAAAMAAAQEEASEHGVPFNDFILLAEFDEITGPRPLVSARCCSGWQMAV